MSWFDRAIKRGVERAVDDFTKSDQFKAIAKNAVNDVLAEPQFAWFHFIKQMQFRLMEVDKAMTGEEAWHMAANVYRQFLEDEKIAFGDDRYTWDRDAARDLVQEYELDHWE